MIREGRATNAAVEIKARDIQTYFGQDFGTVSFDRFRNLDVEDELAFIRNKILYAFYGRPVTESVEFTTAQVAFVTPIYEKICECKKFSPGGNNVCMSVLYVCVVPHDKSKNLQEHADILSSKINTVPLFKVRKCIRTNMNDHRPSCFIYIDEHCRVYSDWKSYLENNKLPKGVLVAPKDGKYQFSGSDLSSVLLEMCLSPQSSPSAEANENMENASLITGFMSMGVFAASFVIPVAGPILIGAAIASTSAGAYGLVSSSKTLADRYTHEQLRLNIRNDEYDLIVGHTPKDVWESWENSYSTFSLNSFFSIAKSRSLSFNSFNDSCIGVNTKQTYVVWLDVKDFDYLKVSMFTFGILLFLYSTSLSRNSFFFYAIGIVFGIFASFMILVYFVSKLFPRKSLFYGSMIGGWACGLFLAQYIWSSLQPLLILYREYVVWYAIVMGFISFITCYWIGPPTHPRNLTIISWTLQATGLVMMYFSCNIINVTIIFAILTFVLKYIPRSWISRFRIFWRRKFPPKRVLLTNEQYYEQGLRETTKALEDLRGYASSPECNQWKLIIKLKDPEKFAKFVSGNVSHVSDDELNSYEKEDFIHRIKQNHLYTDENLTDDNSSSSSDDL